MNLITLLNAAILAGLGFFIRRGKASWLIAGFNTLSKEEKEKYDVKALSSFVSNILFACAAVEVIEARAQYLNNIPVVVAGFIILGMLVIGAAVYANTGNRFKKREK